MQETDVEVKIGTAWCNVTSLSRNQLTCRPPSVQPTAVGSRPSDTPEVVVIVGGNLRFVIGKLSYESPNSGEGQLPKSVIIGVTIGTTFFLAIRLSTSIIIIRAICLVFFWFFYLLTD